jgi:hypothetical protein
MEANKTFQVIEDKQEYVLADLGITDFKSSEILLVSDRTEANPTWSEVIGPENIHDTKLNFAENDTERPAFFTLREDGDSTPASSTNAATNSIANGPSILFWPPLPDQDYRAQWFYYRWTELPTDARSDAHEVLRRWPEALIYLATEQAMLISTKDPEAGMFWKALFINPNPLLNTEYKRIKLYQDRRKRRIRHDGRPSSGVTTLSARRDAGLKGWF